MMLLQQAALQPEALQHGMQSIAWATQFDEKPASWWEARVHGYMRVQLAS